VPVTGAEGVVAVLELFVTHERAGEPGRLGRIARVAGELGPLVERRRVNGGPGRLPGALPGRHRGRGGRDRLRRQPGAAAAWNRGAERMFGWTADEIVGRPLRVIIPERFRQLHEDGSRPAARPSWSCLT
jgi:PAS domain-containing protein